MKKLYGILILFFLAFLTLPSTAQDNEWKINYFEDFDDNSFSWPLGDETQSTTRINRFITESNYVWNITTSDPNVSWMGLNLNNPSDAMTVYQGETFSVFYQ